MRTAHKYFFAMLMAFSVAGLATEASAQSRKPSKRDAAMSQCIAQVQQQFPSATGQQMEPRTAAYKACMRKAGFRP